MPSAFGKSIGCASRDGFDGGRGDDGRAGPGAPSFFSRPCGWGQGVHGRGGRGGYASDDVGEVGFRNKTPAAGAGGDGVKDGALLSGFSRAEEEKAFLPMAQGRISFSTKLLSISNRPSLT